MAPAVATYEPRDLSRTVLYKVIAEHLETFLASLDDDPDAKGLPAYVQRELYDYLQCGILARGFLRLGYDTCKQEVLLAFSGKRRGFCPSGAGRRMAQTAAHLVECVMPWVPTRQGVVSVPIPLRYGMSASRDLTAQVHTIVRTTIAPYYVNQAVRRGVTRHNVQPGSVSFIQRFGGSLNLNLHFHVVFLEGVYLARTEAGLKPRLVKAEPPSNADIAKVLQTISHRVIRKLRRLGYLEAGMEVAVATGYDPLLDNEPEFARTMAASVTQRIAFGERAGEKVRHIGLGAALDGVLGLSSGQDDILGYLVDADRVGAAGSSCGGYTVLKLMEQDPRVLAGLPLVPATAIPPRPDPRRISKPMMFMSGGLDSMVSYVETENFYTRRPSTTA